MSTHVVGADTAQSYASEPIRLSQLTLDRRAQRLSDLARLHQRCSDAGSSSNVDACLARVRAEVRSKALDENFSVAVRERWQTWSRQAKPYRRDLASSAVVPEPDEEATRPHTSGSGSPSESSGDSSIDEEQQLERPAKRNRGQYIADHAQDEDYDHIRESREALLSEMDAKLPYAFRFDERQVMVYAQRLKPRFFSILEEPFHPAQIRQALHITSGSIEESTSDASGHKLTERQPVVLTISFFSGSLDGDLTRNNHNDESSTPAFGQPRDDYANRLSGDGPDGMKRTQTVELLSSQSLDTLRQSVYCWSDEQPERKNWSRRLQKTLRSRGDNSNGSEDAPDTSCSYTRHETPDTHDLQESEEGLDPRFATYTGKRRKTDIIMLIEHKLYNLGYVHGSSEHQADYATLLNRLRQQQDSQDFSPSFDCDGDLSKSFDELESLRVGQTYWMLHQGACVHAFIIEQVRALRPGEDPSPSPQFSNATEAKTGFPHFPKVTWLTASGMLRFASDSNVNYSIGHRILHADGHVAYAYDGTDGPTTRGVNTTQRLAATAATARSRRRDESLLKYKKGRCFSCSSRKAQVGILGGDRVILRTTAPTSEESPMPGVDDHFVSLCSPCAALLGVPMRRPTGNHYHEIDWDAVNSQESRQSGWTIFPLY